MGPKRPENLAGQDGKGPGVQNRRKKIKNLRFWGLGVKFRGPGLSPFRWEVFFLSLSDMRKKRVRTLDYPVSILA